MTAEERLWSYVNKNGPIHPELKSPCWLWKAGTNKKGYGRFGFYGKARFAHRLAYEFLHGSFGDLDLHHKCGIKRCVNPEHLEPLRRGPHTTLTNRTRTFKVTPLRGENARNARLTEVKVREIRKAYPAKTQKQLAEDYGVALHTIGAVLRRETWKHVS